MLLIPILLLISAIVYLVAKYRASKSKTFTHESVLTGFYNTVSFLVFTVYVGVSTRIFQLFRCQKIQNVWYLTADYTVVCFEGDWNDAAALAYPCLVFFVIGIPVTQFLALRWNRKYIDAQKCTSVKSYRRHIHVKRKYGSIFADYVPQYYYFDLIDLIRRLLLTGGLVVAGSDQAVAQLLLGILISSLWLFAILYLKPYKNEWDTLLSSVLAFVIVLTLASGMALKLYQVTVDGNDDYQQTLFGIVMTTTVVIALVGGVLAVVFSFDCMTNRVHTCTERKKKKNESSNNTKVSPANVEQKTKELDETGDESDDESDVYSNQHRISIKNKTEIDQNEMISNLIEQLHKEHEEHDTRLRRKLELLRQNISPAIVEQIVGQKTTKDSNETDETDISSYHVVSIKSDLQMHLHEIDQLHKEHEEHDTRLRKKSELRRQKTSIRVQDRVRARAALRQSKTLQRTKMFHDLAAASIQKIISVMEFRSFDSKQNMVTQGEPASEFMVIMKGAATVFIDGDKIRSFGSLDVLGEGALINENHIRSATVTADVLTQVLVLTRETYQELLLDGTIAQKTNERAKKMSLSYNTQDAERLARLGITSTTTEKKQTDTMNKDKVAEELRSVRKQYDAAGSAPINNKNTQVHPVPTRIKSTGPGRLKATTSFSNTDPIKNSRKTESAGSTLQLASDFSFDGGDDDTIDTD